MRRKIISLPDIEVFRMSEAFFDRNAQRLRRHRKHVHCQVQKIICNTQMQIRALRVSFRRIDDVVDEQEAMCL